MPMFKPINENEATGKVKEVFDEIKSTRKITQIPNFWKYIANSPETLERTWNSLKQVMKAGALDPVTKELIYVAVSMTEELFKNPNHEYTKELLKLMPKIESIYN